MLKIAGVFEVYELDGEHYWLLRDWDGQVIARNGGYASWAGVHTDIERLRVVALTANVVEA